ncbi:putative glycosyl transferase [Enterobacter hormaechei]|nr:putative glycosyl transferase [Enterobacter hormaechei]GJL05452.1 bacteriophage protein [Enterobacter cloacae]
MAEEIKFVVVGHVSRIVHAQRLAALLDAHLLIDDGNHGANWNHRRALEWAAEQPCRVVVVEDDAMPVDLFFTSVTSWLNRFPESLVSFYLGTGRPPQYQMQVAERLIVADKTRSDFITLPRLIHGVCYSVPPQHIERVLSRWDSSKPADYAVGDAYGGAVVYPCYSLVDHADGEPVERHPDSAPRTERRRAWRLA